MRCTCVTGSWAFYWPVVAARASTSTRLRVVADGTWHHIAVTVYQFSPTGGKFYVDGAQVGAIQSDTPARLADEQQPAPAWAAAHRSYADFFRGILDEVEVFPRVLTPAEIQGIFTCRVKRQV